MQLPPQGIKKPAEAGGVEKTALRAALSRFAHIIVLCNLHLEFLRGSHHMSSGLSFGLGALELGLRKSRGGIPDMLLVMDRKVTFTLLVDVGKVLVFEVVSLLGRKISHKSHSFRPGLARFMN